MQSINNSTQSEVQITYNNDKKSIDTFTFMKQKTNKSMIYFFEINKYIFHVFLPNISSLYLEGVFGSVVAVAFQSVFHFKTH